MRGADVSPACRVARAAATRPAPPCAAWSGSQSVPTPSGLPYLPSLRTSIRTASFVTVKHCGSLLLQREAHGPEVHLAFDVRAQQQGGVGSLSDGPLDPLLLLLPMLVESPVTTAAPRETIMSVPSRVEVRSRDDVTPREPALSPALETRAPPRRLTGFGVVEAGGVGSEHGALARQMVERGSVLTTDPGPPMRDPTKWRSLHGVQVGGAVASSCRRLHDIPADDWEERRRLSGDRIGRVPPTQTSFLR